MNHCFLFVYYTLLKLYTLCSWESSSWWCHQCPINVDKPCVTTSFSVGLIHLIFKTKWWSINSISVPTTCVTIFWTMCFVLKHTEAGDSIVSQQQYWIHIPSAGLTPFVSSCLYMVLLPLHVGRLTSVAIFILTHGENSIIYLCLKPKCRRL
jgi:hypothetical protein